MTRPGPSGVTRVMSFNVLTSWARTPAAPWADRRGAVVAAVEHGDAAVVGLQEVTGRQLADLGAELTRYTVIAGAEDNELTRQHNPLLVDGDRFVAVDHGSFWLSDTPEVPGEPAWDAMFGRVATWARLDAPGRGETVVMNVHLDHRGEESRVRAARLLLDEALRWRDAGLPVVLLGDFNDDPGSPAHAALVDGGGLRDTYASVHPRGDARSWMGRRRLDWILVSDGWEVVDAAVHAEAPRGGSDHVPVTADLARG